MSPLQLQCKVTAASLLTHHTSTARMPTPVVAPREAPEASVTKPVHALPLPLERQL